MSSKRLKCEYAGCSKSYCSSFNLKRHLEIVHLGVKKFRCHICGRFLSSKQNLIDHHNIHTGAKPYKCEANGCGMCFRQLSQYYIHQSIHIESSSFVNANFVNSKILDILCRNLSNAVEQEKIKNTFDETLVLLPKICKSEDGQELPKLPEFSTV